MIEPTEQNASKERFAGRLTADVLEERVGHISFSSVRALDLGNMKLKGILIKIFYLSFLYYLLIDSTRYRSSQRRRIYTIKRNYT